MNKTYGAALRFSLFCLLALFLPSAYAQTAPAKVLSSGDVSAYVANFQTIQDQLDALGDKYDDYFFDPFEDEEDDADLAASFRRLREVKPPAEVEAIMKKNGLGDRGFLKFVVISYCTGIAFMEASYAGYAAQYEESPEMMSYLEASMENLKAMKAVIHPADLKLVSSRLNELAPLLEMDGEGY